MRGRRDRRGRQAIQERPLTPRFVPAVVFACVLTTAAATDADPRSHRDELFTFATVLAVGRVAPARCSDLTADPSGVWELSRTLHIESTDDRAVDIETDAFAKTFGEQADKAGTTTWCDDVYAAFGPDGSLMRGLLHRR